MRKVLIFFLYSLFLSSCKGSFTKVGGRDIDYIPYYLKVYEADSLFLTKNYQQSYQILNDLFKNYDPISFDRYEPYYIYVVSMLNIGRSENFSKHLKNLVSKYGFREKELRKNALFNSFLIGSNIRSQQMKTWEKVYDSSINISLRNQIIEMISDDQKVRKKKNRHYNDIIYLDSIHYKKVNDMFNKYGYPNQKKIGRSSLDGQIFQQTDLAIVLLHLGLSCDYDFLKKRIFDYVKRGECSPITYAMVVDRYMLENTGEPFYYMYWKVNNELKTRKKLNFERKKVGLPSIEHHEFWKEQVILNDN